MKNLLILINTIDKSDLFVVILLFIFCAGLAYVISGYLKLCRDQLRLNELLIVKPEQTLPLQELPVGKTLMVLITDEELPIVQYTEDYQEGMRTNMFENTFYLEKYGEQKLERLKTYDIKSIGKGEIRILEQVAMMF